MVDASHNSVIKKLKKIIMVCLVAELCSGQEVFHHWESQALYFYLIMKLFLNNCFIERLLREQLL